MQKMNSLFLTFALFNCANASSSTESIKKLYPKKHKIEKPTTKKIEGITRADVDDFSSLTIVETTWTAANMTTAAKAAYVVASSSTDQEVVQGSSLAAACVSATSVAKMLGFSINSDALSTYITAYNLADDGTAYLQISKDYITTLGTGNLGKVSEFFGLALSKMADTAGDANYVAAGIAFLDAANEIKDSFDASTTEIASNKLVRDELYRASGYMFHAAATQVTLTATLNYFTKATWLDSAAQSFARADELVYAQLEELRSAQTALSITVTSIAIDDELACFRLASAAMFRAIKSDYSDTVAVQRALLTTSLVLKIAVVSKLVDAREPAATTEDVTLNTGLSTLKTAIGTFITSIAATAIPNPLTIASMTYLVGIYTTTDLSSSTTYSVLSLINNQKTAALATYLSDTTANSTYNSICLRLRLSTDATGVTLSPTGTLTTITTTIITGTSAKFADVATAIQAAIDKLMETAQFTTNTYLGTAYQSTHPMLVELQLAKELANRLAYLYPATPSTITNTEIAATGLVKKAADISDSAAHLNAAGNYHDGQVANLKAAATILKIGRYVDNASITFTTAALDDVWLNFQTGQLNKAALYLSNAIKPDNTDSQSFQESLLAASCAMTLADMAERLSNDNTNNIVIDINLRKKLINDLSIALETLHSAVNSYATTLEIEKCADDVKNAVIDYATTVVITAPSYATPIAGYEANITILNNAISDLKAASFVKNSNATRYEKYMSIAWSLYRFANYYDQNNTTAPNELNRKNAFLVSNCATHAASFFSQNETLSIATLNLSKIFNYIYYDQFATIVDYALSDDIFTFTLSTINLFKQASDFENAKFLSLMASYEVILASIVTGSNEITFKHFAKSAEYLATAVNQNAIGGNSTEVNNALLLASTTFHVLCSAKLEDARNAGTVQVVLTDSDLTTSNSKGAAFKALRDAMKNFTNGVITSDATLETASSGLTQVLRNQLVGNSISSSIVNSYFQKIFANSIADIPLSYIATTTVGALVDAMATFDADCLVSKLNETNTSYFYVLTKLELMLIYNGLKNEKETRYHLYMAKSLIYLMSTELDLLKAGSNLIFAGTNAQLKSGLQWNPLAKIAFEQAAYAFEKAQLNDAFQKAYLNASNAIVSMAGDKISSDYFLIASKNLLNCIQSSTSEVLRQAILNASLALNITSSVKAIYGSQIKPSSDIALSGSFSSLSSSIYSLNSNIASTENEAKNKTAAIANDVLNNSIELTGNLADVIRYLGSTKDVVLNTSISNVIKNIAINMKSQRSDINDPAVATASINTVSNSNIYDLLQLLSNYKVDIQMDAQAKLKFGHAVAFVLNAENVYKDDEKASLYLSAAELFNSVNETKLAKEFFIIASISFLNAANQPTQTRASAFEKIFIEKNSLASAGICALKTLKNYDSKKYQKAITTFAMGCFLASFARSFDLTENVSASTNLIIDLQLLLKSVIQNHQSSIDSNSDLLISESLLWIKNVAKPSEVKDYLVEAASNITSPNASVESYYLAGDQFSNDSLLKSVFQINLENNFPKAQLNLVAAMAYKLGFIFNSEKTTPNLLSKIDSLNSIGESLKEAAIGYHYCNDKDNSEYLFKLAAQYLSDSGNAELSLIDSTNQTIDSQANHSISAAVIFEFVGQCYTYIHDFNKSANALKSAGKCYKQAAEIIGVNFKEKSAKSYDFAGDSYNLCAIELVKGEEKENSIIILRSAAISYEDAAKLWNLNALDQVAISKLSSTSILNKATAQINAGESYENSAISFANEAKALKNSGDNEKAAFKTKCAADQYINASVNYDLAVKGLYSSGFAAKSSMVRVLENYVNKKAANLFNDSAKIYKEIGELLILNADNDNANRAYANAQKNYLSAAKAFLRVSSFQNDTNEFAECVSGNDFSDASIAIYNSMQPVITSTLTKLPKAINSFEYLRVMNSLSMILQVAASARFLGESINADDLDNLSGQKNQNGIKALLTAIEANPNNTTSQVTAINTAANELMINLITFATQLKNNVFHQNYPTTIEVHLGDILSLLTTIQTVVTPIGGATTSPFASAILVAHFILISAKLNSCIISLSPDNIERKNSIASFNVANGISFYATAFFSPTTYTSSSPAQTASEKARQCNLYQDSATLIANAAQLYNESAVIYQNATDLLSSAVSFEYSAKFSILSAEIMKLSNETFDVASNYNLAGLAFVNSSVNFGSQEDFSFKKSVLNYINSGNAYKKAGDYAKSAQEVSSSTSYYEKATESFLASEIMARYCHQSLLTNSESESVVSYSGSDLLTDLALENSTNQVAIECSRATSDENTLISTQSLKNSSNMFEKLFNFSKAQQYHFESIRSLLLKTSGELLEADVFSTFAIELFKAAIDDRTQLKEVVNAVLIYSVICHSSSIVKALSLDIDFSSGSIQRAFSDVKNNGFKLSNLLKSSFTTDDQKIAAANELFVNSYNFIDKIVVKQIQTIDSTLGSFIVNAFILIKDNKFMQAGDVYSKAKIGISKNPVLSQLSIASAMLYLMEAFNSTNPLIIDSAFYKAGTALSYGSFKFDLSGNKLDAENEYKESSDQFRKSGQYISEIDNIYNSGIISYNLASILNENNQDNDAFVKYLDTAISFGQAAFNLQTSGQYFDAANAYLYKAISEYNANKKRSAISSFSSAQSNYSVANRYFRKANMKSDAIISTYYQALSLYYKGISNKDLNNEAIAKDIFKVSAKTFQEAISYFKTVAESFANNKKYENAGKMFYYAGLASHYQASSYKYVNMIPEATTSFDIASKLYSDSASNYSKSSASSELASTAYAAQSLSIHNTPITSMTPITEIIRLAVIERKNIDSQDVKNETTRSALKQLIAYKINKKDSQNYLVA